MTTSNLELNHRAAALCEQIDSQCEELGVEHLRSNGDTTLYDFGIHAPGSEAAGLLLARVCLANLATVAINNAVVEVRTEQPIAACMASQYAGWEVKGEKFFAMGSGPMRAASGRETLFDEIGYREEAATCVGVLEASQLPPQNVCRDIAQKCGVEPDRLILLVAPTSSNAGTLQVVARSVETALHKLHELGFDLRRVVKARGTAPLPLVAKDDLAAIGVTNDAILYGGQVTLEVTGNDASLVELGPRVPSSASADYGKPFAEIMARYNNDFYQIDPLLFSAAQVTFVNVDTGNSFVFGEVNPEVLGRSLGGV